jgi:predicted  nucleic acid-binding Zn-ribbon protein
MSIPLKEKKKELESAKIERTFWNKRVSDLEREVQKMENEIAFLQKEISISDHALVRYMERTLFLDTEDFKKKILSKEIQELINAGASRITVDGVTFVIRDKNIVTVVN